MEVLVIGLADARTRQVLTHQKTKKTSGKICAKPEAAAESEG